jgi:hypothetical protein
LDITSTLLAPVQAAYAYISGLQTLNNVFNMLPSTPTSSAAPSWQDKYRSSSSLGITTAEWAYRRFHKRRRYYMSEYLYNHYLTIQMLSSTTEFAALVPLDTTDGKWDDTILCKLPKEGPDDPSMDSIRKNAPDYLTTGFRQAIIKDYATRHFNARAFDAS